MGPARLLPAERQPGRGQDDRRIRMDVPDVLDQGLGPVGVTACPDVVDEHVGSFGQVARVTGEDRAAIPSRASAFDDVVTEATKRIDLLPGEVEVVMDDEDACHATPPSVCFVRSRRAGDRASVGRPATSTERRRSHRDGLSGTLARPGGAATASPLSRPAAPPRTGR